MKAAAYCRVSTDHEDQKNSLENQTLFFAEYIRRNPDWEFVGIYSDEGVSGTSVAKRVQFHKMMEDAARGEIDLILTKEVSRFARNTVDALNYTRQLRRLGVGVFFINDNINTMESDGELRLSLMSMLAQEESRKTSARVRWGMHRQMEQGFVFSPPMLGYDIRDGVMTVDPEEAEIVRRIYDLYVHHGMGTKRIAQKLAEENIPLTKRLKCWSPTAVMRILTNEKYAGDLIQQKTKVTDYLTHKSILNKEEKLVFREHHEPIVDRTIWEEAQRIRQFRSRSSVEFRPAVRSNRYWCSGKVECGVCHGACVTKTKKAQYGTIRVYRCRHTEHFESGTGACSNRTYIDERILCACMQFVIRKLPMDPAEVRNRIFRLLDDSAEKEKKRTEIGQLEKQTADRNAKKKKLLSLLTEEVITKDEYRTAADELDAELIRLEQRIRILRQAENRTESGMEGCSGIPEKIRVYAAQEEVTRQLYTEILDKIVIYADRHADIYLKGTEMPFPVSYRREGRGKQYTVICEDGSGIE